MVDVGRIYTGIRAYADEEYHKRLLSRLYVRTVWFSVLTGMGGGNGDLRPEGPGLVGGGALTNARRKTLAGGYQNNLFFQTGKSTGTKNLTARDTVPQISNPTTDSQDQQRKSAFFKWSKKMTEVLVWNTTMQLGQGQFSLGDAKVEAQNIGMQHHIDHFIEEMWVGEAADQTADLWSEQLGVDMVCDDDNTYGGVDRSVAGNAGWRGFRDATSRSPSIGLQDSFLIQLQGSYTESVQDIHDGFDLVIWNRDAFMVVKAEALAKMGNRQFEGTPNFAKTGILKQGFYYGNTFHTWDPWLKNYNTGSSSGEPDFSNAALFTKASDWCFLTHSDGKMKIGRWVDIGEYTEGGKDAHRTLITSIYQWWNERAWGSWLTTALDA